MVQQQASKSKSVLIFQNIVAPYRTPVFARLAELVDLTVFYGAISTADREQWASKKPTGYSNIISKAKPRKFLGRQWQPPTRVTRFLRQSRPDICISITARSNFIDTFLLMIHCKLIGTKFVVWYAGKSRWSSLKQAFTNWLPDFLIKFAVSQADGAIFYTEYARNCALKIGFSGPHIVGGQILDPSFESVRRQLFSRFPERIVTYVGVFDQRKGIDLLLSAILRLRTAGKWLVKLKLIGGTRDDLKYFSDELSALEGSVELLGKIPRSRLPSIISQSDLMVLPSRHDPWGFVINEAMRCGVPCLCSTKAGANELASKAGWVFDPDQPNGLFEALEEALSNCCDEQLSAQAIEEEREYSSVDLFARKIASLAAKLTDPQTMTPASKKR